MNTHQCVCDRACESLDDAAKRGHDECLQVFIDDGEDVNVVTDNTDGMVPLHWAAYYGNERCIRILIASEANLNITDNYGRTPLHWAIGSQRSACVQILVDAGADPNIADTRGETPLHEAAWSGHDTCIQALVDAGANPNITEVRGKTPLHTAVRYEREICVEKLIAAGATPSVVDNDGETPFQLAVKNEQTECTKILVVRVLAERSLTDDEWILVPKDSDIGHLLPVVMARDGRDVAAKLVSRLHEEKRKVLETAAMCLSRFVFRDVTEYILVRCV
jgi:ankyrin repeat protein